jgi:hypothetical protein
MEKFYPTDMTDEQWELIQFLLPSDKQYSGQIYSNNDK